MDELLETELQRYKLLNQLSISDPQTLLVLEIIPQMGGIPPLGTDSLNTFLTPSLTSSKEDTHAGQFKVQII